MSEIKITINDQEIESLDQAIKLIQEAKEKKGLWRPEIGQSYHFIDPGNTDCFGLGKWENDKWDNNYVLVGNCFPNRIEAQTELDKRKALVRIKDYIARELGECTPDWKSGEDKWVVGYDYENKRFFSDVYSCNRLFLVSVKTNDHADQLIKACESDLKILFGIN